MKKECVGLCEFGRDQSLRCNELAAICSQKLRSTPQNPAIPPYTPAVSGLSGSRVWFIGPLGGLLCGVLGGRTAKGVAKET